MERKHYGMTESRYEELRADLTLKLTPEEIKRGWFFCCDWDGMLLHKSDEEVKCCCSCLKEDKN